MNNRGDTLPRRNLGGAAEGWGRAIEERIVGLEKVVESVNNTVQNLQRTTSGQASIVSRQVGNLVALYGDTPVTRARDASATGFVIPSGTSSPASILLDLPENRATCNLFVVGQTLFFAPGVANANVAAWRVRLSAPGVTSEGPYGSVVPLNNDGKSSTFMFATTIRGLTGALEISAECVAGASHGSGAGNTLSMYCVATFTR